MDSGIHSFSKQILHGSSNETTDDIFELENEMLSQVSDDLLNMTTEETTEYVQKQKLIEMLKQDMTRFEKDKMKILTENRSLITEFKFLQSKRKEIEKNIAETKNELFPIDAELDKIKNEIENLDEEIHNFKKQHNIQ